MAFIHDVLKGAPNESLKSIYHSFIDEIRYDKALKKATIRVVISKQVLEKVKQYNQTKASIPIDGIDAFVWLLKINTYMIRLLWLDLGVQIILEKLGLYDLYHRFT